MGTQGYFLLASVSICVIVLLSFLFYKCYLKCITERTRYRSSYGAIGGSGQSFLRRFASAGLLSSSSFRGDDYYEHSYPRRHVPAYVREQRQRAQRYRMPLVDDSGFPIRPGSSFDGGKSGSSNRVWDFICRSRSDPRLPGPLGKKPKKDVKAPKKGSSRNGSGASGSSSPTTLKESIFSQRSYGSTSRGSTSPTPEGRDSMTSSTTEDTWDSYPTGQSSSAFMSAPGTSSLQSFPSAESYTTLTSFPSNPSMSEGGASGSNDVVVVIPPLPEGDVYSLIQGGRGYASSKTSSSDTA